MKKGLLTVLAASLVFVGCQNYDDQFDDLNAQISALKSQVDGLSSLSGQVASLSGTISGLQSGIAAAQAAAARARGGDHLPPRAGGRVLAGARAVQPADRFLPVAEAHHGRWLHAPGGGPGRRLRRRRHPR